MISIPERRSTPMRRKLMKWVTRSQSGKVSVSTHCWATSLAVCAARGRKDIIVPYKRGDKSSV